MLVNTQKILSMNSTKPCFHIVSFIVLSLMFALISKSAQAERLYFIDAHSQIDHKIENIKLVLRRMDENQVQITLLAARGKRDDADIIKLAEKSDGRIIASIRTKGNKYTKNQPQFYHKLKKQSSNRQFGAIAEVIMYHAQKGNKAKEVDIYPHDKRVHAALEAARKNNWPFVVHIEFASLAGKKRKRYMAEFESLLKENHLHPVLLIHMGQLQPQEAERLLAKHKNFHLLTSHADPITVNTSSQPWVNLFQGKRFKPAWKTLMLKYPDRFVFALDNVWARHWKNDYTKKIKLWRKALAGLPPETAAKIAHGNAERLYNLNQGKR